MAILTLAMSVLAEMRGCAGRPLLADCSLSAHWSVGSKRKYAAARHALKEKRKRLSLATETCPPDRRVQNLGRRSEKTLL
jgi:hypothetical protein